MYKNKWQNENSKNAASGADFFTALKVGAGYQQRVAGSCGRRRFAPAAAAALPAPVVKKEAKGSPPIRPPAAA